MPFACAETKRDGHVLVAARSSALLLNSAAPRLAFSRLAFARLAPPRRRYKLERGVYLNDSLVEFSLRRTHREVLGPRQVRGWTSMGGAARASRASRACRL